MSHPGTHITRIARGLSTVTSQIFRCHGLQNISADADSIGFHDVAYWLAFVTAVSIWFLFFFAPQRERLSMLDGRLQVLKAHCSAEKRELARLERSIDELARGDPHAWERAARGRLGWVEPGEVTDLANLAPRRVVPAGAENANPPARSNSNLPVLPRPVIPPVPAPSAALRRTQNTNMPAPDMLGPTLAAPPIPPRNYIPPQIVQADSRAPRSASAPRR
ncbi:MAG TPA: hypothetical protein VEK08_14090 [Planctomycetota bacterium]|nr:hypothetical protein [Planctomycetota bacterium]